MVKAVLCRTYDKKQKGNLKYVWRHTYTVKLPRNRQIQLKLRKETSDFAKGAGWGLQAVTSIPAKTIIGKFVMKQRLVEEAVIGTYCLQKGKKYAV